MQLIILISGIATFAIFGCHAQGIDPVCTLPVEVGPCDSDVSRYFYNTDTGHCEEFTYGGCDGNANNFENVIDCQNRCADICQLPKATESCSRPGQRWYYNKEDKRCEELGTDECSTNANSFQRQELCESRCIHPCWQPAKSGPCKALKTRYYYDMAARSCKQFIWGGCKENSNNFETKEDCESMCKGICHQAKKAGPCEAAIPRYYYNKATRQCELFEWGGCEPNGNNFLTERECEAACECYNIPLRGM